MINPTSLAKPNAVQQLGLDLSQFKVHIALVTESWFNCKIADNCVSIDSYVLYRKDRSRRKGGGVCAYVINDVHCYVMPYKNSNDAVEAMWLICTFSGVTYCIVCLYHPPKPKYKPIELEQSLSQGIDYFLNSVPAGERIVVIAGDFNTFDATFLETQYGLEQIVLDNTHGQNTLDKVYTSRPDLYSALVVKSLVNTKHLAVVFSTIDCFPTNISTGNKPQKIPLYDLRAHNVDRLRYYVATYDWTSCLQCTDIQSVYDFFISGVQSLIRSAIPVKNVVLGRKDPPYVTPLIKSLLKRRYRLRRRGHIGDANVLAEKINLLIQEARRTQLARLGEATPKELWNAVKTTNNNRCKTANYPSHLFYDVDSVNSYFSDVCTDQLYDANHVTSFWKFLNIDPNSKFHFDGLEPFNIEYRLRHMKQSSPGTDNIPSWFFRNCSYEIADIIAYMLKLSFSTGTVPSQWKKAIVTPVPKVPKPTAISDYRPISVTPLLSRLAERILVTKWLLPAIPNQLLDDQFGFKPTGSTECALVYMMNKIAAILEECEYVRCLMIDFSRAFDVVNHAILLPKISNLSLPDCIHNWIICFLSGRQQMTNVAGVFSQYLPINQGILQGSGVGPIFYIVMESDLRTLSPRNLLFKYADDTNLLVPANSDLDITDEFEHIKQWAINNKMLINMNKTKELVFRRPSLNHFLSPTPITHIPQVDSAKLLGIIFNTNLNFQQQVDLTLKICSQRGYLLKLLRDQGLPPKYMDTVFNSLILSKIRYAICAWGGHLTTTQKGQINKFLKRMFRYHYTTVCHDFNSLLLKADTRLFASIRNSQHCLHTLLPSLKSSGHYLRELGHPYELPTYQYSFSRATFVIRSLYNFR